jgi:hypothetical protein
MVVSMSPTRLVLLLSLAGWAPATRAAAPAPAPAATAAPAPAPTPAAAPASEVVLDRGGDLAALTALEPTIRFDGDALAVTGMAEVPGDSRLQASYAMVDAITRSELAKAIAVHIVSLETDRSTGSGETEIALYHAEATKALFGLLPQPTHGWQKVRQGDTVILRLFGRLRLPKADVTRGVAATLSGRGADPSRADAVVSALAAKP